MNTHTIITRLAPSPTGRMHAGNILSFLVAWIMARREQGKVLLRIEDIDQGRSRPEFIDLIQKDLSLLGLFWDEKVALQSKREALYEHAFMALKNQGLVYECFCSRSDLQSASAPHAGEEAIYAKTCYGLHPAEVSRKRGEFAQKGRTPSLRLHVGDVSYSFEDVFQGKQLYVPALCCGDVVIKRSDGGYAYQLAVVVDDEEQGVNLVVRGADLLSSSAVQMYIQDCLGYRRPGYAHIPVLMSSQGKRIAKRNKDASLDELLVVYGSPEGVLGHIAFVAGLIDTDSPTSAQELLESARLDALCNKQEILWH